MGKGVGGTDPKHSPQGLGGTDTHCRGKVLLGKHQESQHKEPKETETNEDGPSVSDSVCVQTSKLVSGHSKHRAEMPPRERRVGKNKQVLRVRAL